MRDHKNAWPIIAEHLRRQHLLQKDLARMLGVSSSAVTQLKQESYLLNFRQLARVASALNLDENQHLELCRMIFRARQDGGAEMAVPGEYPVVTAEEFRAYCPSLESLERFLCRRTGTERVKNVQITFASPGAIAAVEIRVDAYPVPGDVVLAMLCDGSLYVRRFQLDDTHTVLLRDDWCRTPEIRIPCSEINRRICRIFPVGKLFLTPGHPEKG